MSRIDRGFTLIELMIVLVVIAVLGSIAVPTYRQYVLRSHRVEATAALLNIAAKQEKYYLACNTYTEDMTGPVDASDCDDRGLGVADGGAADGVQTDNGWFTITADADVDSFSLTATAIGPQAEDSDCSTFTIDFDGTKSATSDKCWK